MKKLLLGTLLLLPSILFAGELQSKRYFQNNGGLIDHISPLLVPDNSASAIQNITLDDRGALSKRNGYTVVQSTSAFIGYSTWTVNGGGFHKAASGSDFFAVVTGTAIYRVSSAFTTYGTVTGTVTVTASPSNLAQVTHLQDKAIFCNELDKPFYVGPTGTAFQLTSTMVTFSSATTCATYGVYLVVGNTKELAIAYPNRIRWSDINNINSFPALNYIDVEPDDGDKIVGIISFDDSIYIFKQRSIYRMLITGLDGPNAFIIRPVSRNIGAWSKMSIKVIPNVGIGFLAQNTAYILSDSGLEPIGDKIQRTFDGLQRTMWVNAVAEVYPKKYQYWLAVSTTGTTNETVLVYDYIQKNWTTYTGMAVNMLSQAEDSNGNNILISGDYNATTYKQDTGTSDNPRNVSTAIRGVYTTGVLTIDTPEITKGFKYLYIFTSGEGTFTLGVEGAYDYSSGYELSTSVATGGAVYDTALYDTDSYALTGVSALRIELNRSAKALKLRFTNANVGQEFGLVGWVLVYSMENYSQ